MRRMPMERFKDYQDRRRRADLAIARKLKPRMVHESVHVVFLPLLGEDDKVDRAVQAGEYRHLKIVVIGTKTVRVGVTKGITYRKPKYETA